MKLSKLTLLLAAIFWLNLSFGQSNPAYSKKIESLMESLNNPINESDLYIKSKEPTILPSELAAIKNMNKMHGFATISKVGEEQAHQFFMMVLQCDQDPHFQFLVLKQMEKHLSDREIQKADYAILKDRIHVNKNMPQVFGTQYMFKAGTNFPELFPVKNVDLLEKRRIAMNLADLPDANSISQLLASSEE